MTIYTLYCERCGGAQTHKTTFGSKDYVNAKEHPDNGREVFCRNCERGRSKADVEDGAEIWAVAEIEQGVPLTIHQDLIREDETLEEHIERRLKEDQLNTLAAKIADGLRESDVEYSYHEKE